MTNPHPLTEVDVTPCPFCGGDGLPHHVPTGWRVSCKNCDCQPRPGFPLDTEAEAITVWNTRSTSAQPSTEAVKLADERWNRLVEFLEYERDTHQRSENEAEAEEISELLEDVAALRQSSVEGEG